MRITRSKTGTQISAPAWRTADLEDPKPSECETSSEASSGDGSKQSSDSGIAGVKSEKTKRKASSRAGSYKSKTESGNASKKFNTGSSKKHAEATNGGNKAKRRRTGNTNAVTNGKGRGRKHDAKQDPFNGFPLDGLGLGDMSFQIQNSSQQQMADFGAAPNGSLNSIDLLRLAAATLKTPAVTPSASPKRTEQPNDGPEVPWEFTPEETTRGSASQSAKSRVSTQLQTRFGPEIEKQYADRRTFHNARERMRRVLIRDLFGALRDAIPSLASRSMVADREILLGAAQYIAELQREGNRIQSDLQRMRQEHATLREEVLYPHGSETQPGSKNTNLLPKKGKFDSGHTSDRANFTATKVEDKDARQLAEVLAMLGEVTKSEAI
eukprot:m.181306 g.181306  ORF g.181306 m.181306 type:complete len:382 (-) comp15514_c0_seq10:1893-3038(-)